MTYAQTTMLIVTLSFTLLCILIALMGTRKRSKANAKAGKGTLNDFYIGGRSMGGFVLAMTLIATFTSSSSFLGGPGTAYSTGLAWVFLSMIQVPTAFIILAILGKKLAVIGRKINGVTINDLLRARYKSPALVILCSLAIVVFFLAQMMAQFRGGAILFQTITGMDYKYALMLFGGLVILYTVFGGFSAVARTDAIQGILMAVGGIILLCIVIRHGNSDGAITERMTSVNPGWDSVFGADGKRTVPYIMSYWILVGVGVLGLPQTTVRCFGFKSAKSVHSAMIIGTVAVGFLMLSMHIAGAYAPAVINMNEVHAMLGSGAGTDYIISAVILKYCNPLVAGLFFAAPLAAIMSTVDSLLLCASSAIVKDIYVNYIMKNKEQTKTPAFQKKIKGFSMAATALLGVLVVVLSLWNPSSIVTLNLYAMGGLECAFFFPVVGGLFWKRANATGAFASSVIGIVAFIIISRTGWSLGGTMAVVPAFFLTGIVFAAVSMFGPKPEESVLALFFPKKEPDQQES